MTLVPLFILVIRIITIHTIQNSYLILTRENGQSSVFISFSAKPFILSHWKIHN